MEFPVDMLATLSHEDLEQCAENYLSDLLHSNPDEAESFVLSSSRQIPITVSSVGFVPMYGADLVHKVLALFAPEDPFTAVALYLAGQWWAVEDVLKTADCSRTGLLKVKTLGERIVLYTLNRIVYRAKEMNKNEVPFLCHHHSDYAKILWKDGKAIGFYSVKLKGSLCGSFLTQRYLFPVMDSIFVRKAHRGQRHGLQILEDFVDTFKEDTLGLKFPLSHTMYKVCENYLRKYPADEDLLWEVESVGGPFQRSKISSKIETLFARDVNHHVTTDASLQNTDKNETLMEQETTPGSAMIFEEVTEDVVVLKQVKVTEDIEDMAVSTDNELRRKRLRENSDTVKETVPVKINRVVGATEKLMLEEEEEEEQLVPADEDAAEAVTLQVDSHDEDKEVVKVEPEQVNGELINSLREKKPVLSEDVGELTLTQEEENEGQNDGNVEEEEALESKDIVHAVYEEPDKGLTEPVEETSSLVEKEMLSPQDEVHSQSEEKASLPEESEGHLQVKYKAPLSVEEENSMEMVDKDPIAMEDEGGGLLITEEETSSQAEVVGASSLEEGNEIIKDKDEQEPAAPLLEMTDEDVAVHSQIMTGEETASEELSSGSERVEKEDVPAESCSSLDGAEVEGEQIATAEDLSQDTVLLVGLKEVSYQQFIVNENLQQSEEEIKHNEGTEGTILEKEDKTRIENEADVKIMKEKTKKEQEASAVEEEPDSLDKSSDETNELPVVDMRVLRRKSKQIQPKPKRKSMRKKGVNYSNEAERAEASEEPEIDNEEEVLVPKVEITEEKPVEAEEERNTTTEEEGEDRSSDDDDDDDPPVVNRRVLRRKTKVIQSMPRTKAKRHGKP